MAKKKLNPIATALTIAALGATGWAIWTYVIKPRRDKKRVESMGVDSINNEVLDAQFELVDDQQTA
jgi:hypothetical protein